jgi:hypothetical protein
MQGKQFCRSRLVPGAIHSRAKAFLGPGTSAAVFECPCQPLRSRYTQPPKLTHLPIPSSPQRLPFLPTAAPPPDIVPGIRHRHPALFFRVRLPLIPRVDSFHSPSGLPSFVCLTSFGSVGTQFWNLCVLQVSAVQIRGKTPGIQYPPVMIAKIHQGLTNTHRNPRYISRVDGA